MQLQDERCVHPWIPDQSFCLSVENQLHCQCQDHLKMPLTPNFEDCHPRVVCDEPDFAEVAAVSVESFAADVPSEKKQEQ